MGVTLANLYCQRDQQLYFDKTKPYHSFNFHLVFRRNRTDEEAFDPDMTFPIAPTLHPLCAREPAKPSLPLPWEDCHIAHYFQIKARCRSIRLDSLPADIRALDDDEQFRVWRAIQDDQVEENRVNGVVFKFRDTSGQFDSLDGQDKTLNITLQ